jgi:CDP-diglyceride synthetase
VYIIKEDELHRRETTSSLIVLSGIYAIIASLAITEILGAYSEALAFTKAPIRFPVDLIVLLTSNAQEYNYFTTTFLVLTFFSLASTSYLGTTFFLSRVGERPREEITKAPV